MHTNATLPRPTTPSFRGGASGALIVAAGALLVWAGWISAWHGRRPAAGAGALPPEILFPNVRVRAGTACGSGVVIGKKQVLTVAHLAGRTSDCWVDLALPGGAMRTVAAKVRKVDARRDLAVLETAVPLKNFLQARLGSRADAARLQPGAPLFCVGATMGYGPLNATRGYLSAKNNPKNRQAPAPWQMSAGAYFGNSGGGVYDAATRRLVGLVSGGAAPNLTFFIPLPEILDFLEK